jgi:hypothetical protein
MLLTIAAIFTFFGLGLFGYLFWQNVPVTLGSFTLSDLTNLAALTVAIFSLSIAIATFQKSIKDSEEQQKSLDASRSLLQAVVQTVKDQQHIFTENLETSKELLSIQKQQQSVLSTSLETSKGLLAIQKEQQTRAEELASRKPKLQLLIGDREATNGIIEVNIEANNQSAILRLNLKNIGSDRLRKPLHIVRSSREEVSIRFENTAVDNHKPYQTQLAGLNVYDMLPFSSAQNVYQYKIHLVIPKTITDFDLLLTVTGENLDAPFKARIRVKVVHTP